MTIASADTRNANGEPTIFATPPLKRRNFSRSDDAPLDGEPWPFLSPAALVEFPVGVRPLGSDGFIRVARSPFFPHPPPSTQEFPYTPLLQIRQRSFVRRWGVRRTPARSLFAGREGRLIASVNV